MALRRSCRRLGSQLVSRRTRLLRLLWKCKGLGFRVSGLGFRVLGVCGVKVQRCKGVKVADALKKGDGCIYAPPCDAGQAARGFRV